jgi:hypothetical protein
VVEVVAGAPLQARSKQSVAASQTERTRRRGKGAMADDMLGFLKFGDMVRDYHILRRRKPLYTCGPAV